MAENWAFVSRQDEASRWLQMSAYGFWLCHPAGLEVRTPFRPEGFLKEWDRFWRLGEELDVLELDLTECLNEFKNAYQGLYRESKHLALKKFSIVYHTDNFNVRVHKFVENMHALIALVANVDPAKRPRKNDPSIRERTRSALDDKGLRSLLECVRDLDVHKGIQRAREQRNAFVHLYRDEPRDWRWAMLAPAARISDYGSGPDELAAELRRIAEPQHLDDYADRKANELLDLLRDIQVFRDKLYSILLREVAVLVSTRSAATRERLRWLLDWAEAWRELGRGAKEHRRDSGCDGLTEK